MQVQEGSSALRLKRALREPNSCDQDSWFATDGLQALLFVNSRVSVNIRNLYHIRKQMDRIGGFCILKYEILKPENALLTTLVKLKCE